MALTLWKDKSPAHMLDNLKGQLDKWFGEYFSKNKDVAQGERNPVEARLRGLEQRVGEDHESEESQPRREIESQTGRVSL